MNEPTISASTPTDPQPERRRPMNETTNKTPVEAPEHSSVCPKCGNFFGGHACGSFDICCCHSPNMNEETKPNQEPRFTRALNQGMAVLRPVFEERSRQYGDTMEECRWLTMLSSAEAMGLKLEPWQARILFLAGQDDMKYWRQLGGFKFDSLLDRLAYCGALVGELDRATCAGLTHETQRASGTPSDDPDALDRAIGLRAVEDTIHPPGSSAGLQRADRDAEYAGPLWTTCPTVVGS